MKSTGTRPVWPILEVHFYRTGLILNKTRLHL